MYHAHKNSNDKPRHIPKMSARKLARFRSENAGAYPRSSITPKKEVSQWPRNTYVQNAVESASVRSRSVLSEKTKCALSAEPAKIQRRISKPIPSRKKRSTTPIRSTPFEGRLDKLSHWTASGNLKLYGDDKIAMRARIFERAGGRCEEMVFRPYAVRGDSVRFTDMRCPNAATEWSHRPCVHIKVGSGHGQGFKCDSDLCGAAECERCHRNSHGQY